MPAMRQADINACARINIHTENTEPLNMGIYCSKSNFLTVNNLVLLVSGD